MTEQTYTVKQVAQLLNVCDTTVRRLIEKGRIKAYKLSGPKSHWRINQSEVDRITSQYNLLEK